LFSCRVELASAWLPAKESLARCSYGAPGSRSRARLLEHLGN